MNQAPGDSVAMSGPSPQAAQAELAEIPERHGTDKGRTRTEMAPGQFYTAKWYTDSYARLFNHLRGEPIRLLEIGVASGSSLRMWAEFLPRAQITGIDIHAARRREAADRIDIHIGDQTDADFVAAVAAQAGPFDIVIDDGGHTMYQQQTSLQLLWPHVAPGGFYAIEDLHTAYHPHHGGGYLEPNSTVERVKHLIDALNRQEQAPRIADDVAGLWFATGLVVLLKPGAHPPRSAR